MVIVEVVDSPKCPKCRKTMELAERVVRDYEGVELRRVDVLEDSARIVELGVLTTPAVAVNGEVVFTGLVKEGELRRSIEEAIKR